MVLGVLGVLDGGKGWGMCLGFGGCMLGGVKISFLNAFSSLVS